MNFLIGMDLKLIHETKDTTSIDGTVNALFSNMNSRYRMLRDLSVIICGYTHFDYVSFLPLRT